LHTNGKLSLKLRKEKQRIYSCDS